MVETFSMGMRQKMRIAQAVVNHPALLILDEPTRFLDPSARAELLAWVGELREQGVSLLVSSHEIAEIAKICDRIVVLMEGEIELHKPIAELMESSDTWEIQPIGEIEHAMQALKGIGLDPYHENDDSYVKMTSADCLKIVDEFSKKQIPIRSIFKSMLSVEEALARILRGKGPSL